MSRAETTAMLSKLVEKRLKNQTAFWASEVNFDRNTPDERRVDYVGFKPWNINGEPVPASVEKGCFEFYEVKSCMADFTSGNGLKAVLIVFTIVFGLLSFASFASIVALFIADWMAKHF